MSEEMVAQYMYSYPHKTAYRPLEGVDIGAYFPALSRGDNTLYLHIPFCQAKCGYCNLFSIAGAGEELIASYLQAMERQLAQYDEILSLRSVSWQSLVLGGGTPILLSVDQLERLFSLVEKYLGVSLQQLFVALEVAPLQCDAKKLDYLRKRGVDRISLGIQSFEPEVLKTLGRVHQTKDCQQALAVIKSLDFPQVNLDFIYDIPGQAQESLQQSLEMALTYEPDELFIYPLYIKPQTPLYGIYPDFAASRPVLSPAYGLGADYLKHKGYHQRSMRRFVKEEPLQESSCGFENMLSIGCGGRSYLGDLHFSEPYGVRPEACQNVLGDYLAKTDFLQGVDGYLLDEDEQLRRYVIKNILHGNGLNHQEMATLFGIGKLGPIDQLLTQLVSKEMVHTSGDIFRLTDLGLQLSDWIGPSFISPTVQEKMKTYVRK